MGGPFLDASSELLCRFGNEIVNKTFFSANELKCLSPRIEVGNESAQMQTVEVHVSVNGGADFSFSSAILTYYPNVRIVSTNPSHGIIEGGTMIAVSGYNFYDAPSLA